MSARVEVVVPDIGDEAVDVVEILVSPGDVVAKEDSLITLESDKASMDVPSSDAGTVREIHVQVGEKVSTGGKILTLELAAGAATTEATGAQADGGPDRPAGGSGEPPPEPPREAADSGPGAPSRATAGDGSSAPEETSPAPAPSKAAGPSADLHAEILVLGAGPGGYTAAFRAADLGKKVVLVERHRALGGVCLNVGCIPSKALLHVARVMEEVVDLGEHGVAYGKPKVDLDRLRGWKDSVVGQLTGGLGTLAKRRKVEVLTGTARFTSPNALVVEGEEGERTVSFDAAIIAAGSRVVRIPGIPYDDPRVWDSTAALELEEVPKKLLLVGGGIIGLEMAMVYGALGTKLTIVELLDGLIPGCDRDLVRPLAKRLAGRYGAEIHLGTKVTEIKSQQHALKAFFQGKGAPPSATFDRVLVAVGRRPNGDRIGAEAAGVEVTDRGFIRVDNRQRTNVPHIFAIGDVVGQPMLAHKATHEGRVAAEVAAGEKSAFDARVIPSVAYTDPEIAWVGLTETEAKEKGVPYGKGAFPWAASGRSLGMGRSDGSTKVLFDPETHRVLGGGVVGPNAGDLIAEVALAIEMGAEAADLALTVHPHPTLSETVAFAAEAFEGTITDLYLPKRKSR